MVAIPRTVIISRGGFPELCTGQNKEKQVKGVCIDYF